MISELITFLEANTSSFTTIDHAWDTEPVDQVREIIPALFVFPGEDNTESDGTDYLVSKMLHSDINIYIVCLNTELEALKTELRATVLGWNAGAAYTDTELVSGKPISLKGGIVWWHEVYRNARNIRASY